MNIFNFIIKCLIMKVLNVKKGLNVMDGYGTFFLYQIVSSDCSRFHQKPIGRALPGVLRLKSKKLASYY